MNQIKMWILSFYSSRIKFVFISTYAPKAFVIQVKKLALPI